MSTTLTCPIVAPLPDGPLFDTITVKVALVWPGKNVPPCDLATVKSGVATFSVALTAARLAPALALVTAPDGNWLTKPPVPAAAPGPTTTSTEQLDKPGRVAPLRANELPFAAATTVPSAHVVPAFGVAEFCKFAG